MSYKVFLDYTIQTFRNKKSFLKYFSESIVYRSLVVLINFATGILISNELLEANRGQFSLFLGALTIANILLNMGFNGSAIYYAKKEPEKIKLYLSSNLIVTSLSIVLIVISLFYFDFSFKFQSDSLRIIFVLCYFVFSFSNIFRCFQLGLDNNLFLLKLDFTTRIFYLIFILFSYYFHKMSVIGICAFLIIEYLFFTIIAYRKTNVSLLPIVWDIEFLKSIFFINAKNYIAGLLYILVLKGDQFIIKYFNGNYSVGVYTTSSTIIENMLMFTGILMNILLPKLLSETNYENLLRKTKSHLSTIIAINILLSIIIYFLSPFLYFLYFKKPNPEGVEVLRILLIGFNTWAIFAYLYYVYFSVRLKKSLLIIMGLGLGLNIFLNLILIPKMSIIGSAWASSICYTFICVLAIFDLYYLKRKNYLKKKSIIEN